MHWRGCSSHPVNGYDNINVWGTPGTATFTNSILFVDGTPVVQVLGNTANILNQVTFSTSPW
jgi:hypothetical protein